MSEQSEKETFPQLRMAECCYTCHHSETKQGKWGTFMICWLKKSYDENDKSETSEFQVCDNFLMRKRFRE